MFCCFLRRYFFFGMVLRQEVAVLPFPVLVPRPSAWGELFGDWLTTGVPASGTQQDFQI